MPAPRRLAGAAGFASRPTPAELTDIDVDAANGIDRATIGELGTCHYLESATLIVLIGPGIGKTTCQSDWQGLQPLPGL